MAQTYQYDSFGNIVNTTGSLTQPYAFTGREYDPETGLYYYRARYYDAKTGRFLQQDPIWDIHLYGYCSNNPINWADPWGLKDYSATETKDIISNAVKNTGSGIKDFFTKPFSNFGAGKKYDYRVNEPTSTFDVNGQIMCASEFGNYLAAYALTHNYLLAGYVGALMAGDYFGLGDAIDDLLNGKMPKNWLDDPISRDFLKKGMSDAIDDYMNGR